MYTTSSSGQLKNAFTASSCLVSRSYFATKAIMDLNAELAKVVARVGSSPTSC